MFFFYNGDILMFVAQRGKCYTPVSIFKIISSSVHDKYTIQWEYTAKRWTIRFVHNSCLDVYQIWGELKISVEVNPQANSI